MKDHLLKRFNERFGEGDTALYFSPGRVNLIGEHTDYNGGYVFPCALSFGVYLALRPNNTNTFRLASENLDFETTLPAQSPFHPVGREWVNYPIGVLAQFAKRDVVFEHGLDLLFWGDVPNGAGLSSSAAIEMVMAYALNDHYNFNLDRLTLVKMAQKAEHEFAGVMCGIMDQFASGMGKKDHAIFLDCNTLEYDLIPIVLDGVKIVISNSNSPHKLDAGKYNERVAECKAAVAALQAYRPINNLAELTVAEFTANASLITDEVVRRRARHVVSEVERTREAVAELQKGNLDRFGLLMKASHDSLRDDYEVTGSELDSLYYGALEVPGVIGTRMTGGGFGGCTVSLVKEEAVENFITHVGDYYQKKCGITPAFYVAEVGDGSHRVL